MEQKLTNLVERLKKAFDGRLVSAILYGSAAMGDWHEHSSDLNILVCVESAHASGTARFGADLSLVARTAKPAATAPDGGGSQNLYRLLPDGISRHARAPPRAARYGRD